MRFEGVAAALALSVVALAVASPGFADGTTVRTFRVLASGDFGAVAISSFCSDESYAPPPGGIDPGQEGLVDRAVEAPWQWECWVVKDRFGYDGETGASWDTSGHWGDPFVCRASSGVGPVASITVTFERDGDVYPSEKTYPDTVWYPLDETGLMPGGVDVPDDPTGVPDVDDQVPNVVQPGLRDGFLITGIARGGVFWDELAGEVWSDYATIFVHAGTDVTVECVF